MPTFHSVTSYYDGFPDLAGKPVILYGTGPTARGLLNARKHLSFHIVGILDRDDDSGCVEGVPLLRTEDAACHAKDVILAAHPWHQDEIASRLAFLKDKDVTIHFSPDYYVYAAARLKLAKLRDGAIPPRVVPGVFRSDELNRIGIECKTDKSDAFKASHDFLRKYEPFLRPYREEAIYLMELGVFNGGSLATWAQYFPRGTIIGVDMAADALRFTTEHIIVTLGDLGRSAFLETLPAGAAQIIVDDASHQWAHQLSALFALYPLMPAGGIYIVEDIHTSFHPLSKTYALGEDTAPFTVLTGIAEHLNASKYLGNDLRPLREDGAYGVHGAAIRKLAGITDAVVFMEHSCILIKK